MLGGGGLEPARGFSLAMPLRISGLARHHSINENLSPGCAVFVTWRLRDSLPAERSFEMAHLTSGHAFVTWDRLLDTARSGPMYLRQPEIAALLRDQLWKVEEDGWCSIDAWVIMPNHVHVL